MVLNNEHLYLNLLFLRKVNLKIIEVSLEFYNNLDFDEFKRFYIVTNPKKGTVRAWHGHKLESKLIKVFKGIFIVFTLKLIIGKTQIKINILKYEMNENSGLICSSRICKRCN